MFQRRCFSIRDTPSSSVFFLSLVRGSTVLIYHEVYTIIMYTSKCHALHIMGLSCSPSLTYFALNWFVVSAAEPALGDHQLTHPAFRSCAYVSDQETRQKLVGRVKTFQAKHRILRLHLAVPELMRALSLICQSII